MVGQHAVARSGPVLDQGGDFARLIDEAHMAGTVLVHGDGALEGPETHRKYMSAGSTCREEVSCRAGLRGARAEISRSVLHIPLPLCPFTKDVCGRCVYVKMMRL